MRLVLFIPILIISGCSSSDFNKPKLVNDYVSQGMSVSDATAAYIHQFHTDLHVYTPKAGIQQDDSQWINDDNLIHVASLLTCPPSANAYSLERFARKEDDGIHIIANRSNCTVNVDEVRRYLDQSIHDNQVENGRRVQAEIEKEKSSPVGPFVVGCEDYQHSFRGEELATVAYAYKEYSTLNQVYVGNLYKLGFSTASYAPPSADCKYLAAISGVR